MALWEEKLVFLKEYFIFLKENSIFLKKIPVWPKTHQLKTLIQDVHDLDSRVVQRKV